VRKQSRPQAQKYILRAYFAFFIFHFSFFKLPAAEQHEGRPEEGVGVGGADGQLGGA
jgi:hypothetical protein